MTDLREDGALVDVDTARYEVRSMSGELMSVSDADLILIVIADQKWRQCSDYEGNRLIGIENAVIIRDALRSAGFEIVRKQP